MRGGGQGGASRERRVDEVVEESLEGKQEGGGRCHNQVACCRYRIHPHLDHTWRAGRGWLGSDGEAGAAAWSRGRGSRGGRRRPASLEAGLRDLS